jgi:methionyl-tRNA synthetase
MVAPSRALDAAWSLIRATNAFLESNEPWKSEPGAAVDAVMGDALEAFYALHDTWTPVVVAFGSRLGLRNARPAPGAKMGWSPLAALLCSSS